ncbi:MAG TPA: hypothetical protein PLM71_01795 [Syntrophorhabdaceae bacterium]|nr:hypothetical protein [Syntrophorhabdaceae bacterium]
MGLPYFYGDSDADIVIVGWGSTYGVIKDSIDILSRNKKIAMMHFSELYPLPDSEDYMNILKKAKKTIGVENNARGQFARLIKTETGFEFDSIINRYDGRPFYSDLLARSINDIIG